jgi:transglutaminase-like putative cysteine protease
VPKELFLRDVLPYANLDERRDDWRGDFRARFAPLVAGCRSAAEAAQVLNRAVFPALRVKYHATKRQKPNQSPQESAQIGYASCSGLSIILVDACRAVGVPARVAGTPLWADGSGNHTWVEVWDRQWHFVGAAEPGPLDQTWFVDNAAQADPAKPQNRIYAADVERANERVFPLVWNPGQQDVRADDVTAFYKLRRKLTVTAGGGVEVRLGGELVAASPSTPATFELAAGATYVVTAAGASRDVELPASADVAVTLPIGK